MKRNLDSLTWLTKHRAALPETLLHLLQRGDPQVRMPGRGWQRLVGAGFALWRALPLMPEGGERPLHSDADAETLLTELVQHNRLTYGEELKCQDWMVGFYLNK